MRWIATIEGEDHAGPLDQPGTVAGRRRALHAVPLNIAREPHEFGPDRLPRSLRLGAGCSPLAMTGLDGPGRTVISGPTS